MKGESMDSRKIVFRETAVILLGQAICIAAMLGIYALLDRFSAKVLWGGVVGGGLATLNFFFMAVGATLAADRAEKQNTKGGQALLTMSYILRFGLLALVLFACLKSGVFDLLATLLPLVFTRPILTVAEFFRKPGDKK